MAIEIKKIDMKSHINGVKKLVKSFNFFSN